MASESVLSNSSSSSSLSVDFAKARSGNVRRSSTTFTRCSTAASTLRAHISDNELHLFDIVSSSSRKNTADNLLDSLVSGASKKNKKNGPLLAAATGYEIQMIVISDDDDDDDDADHASISDWYDNGDEEEDLSPAKMVDITPQVLKSSASAHSLSQGKVARKLSSSDSDSKAAADGSSEASHSARAFSSLVTPLTVADDHVPTMKFSQVPTDDESFSPPPSRAHAIAETPRYWDTLTEVEITPGAPLPTARSRCTRVCTPNSKPRHRARDRSPSLEGISLTKAPPRRVLPPELNARAFMDENWSGRTQREIEEGVNSLVLFEASGPEYVDYALRKWRTPPAILGPLSRSTSSILLTNTPASLEEYLGLL